jgi:hypothetical protein
MSTDGTTGGSPSTGAPASTGNPASTGVPASTGAQMMGWGDDWRQRLAAGSTNSERELQQLARYESPEQIWRKARELEARMSAGEFKTALKAGASADELARWRAENGIPSEAKGYKLNLPQGKDPKEDEDFINAFLKSAHEANYTQAQVDTALKGFYAEVDRQEHALTEAEGLSVKKTEDLLRTKWGADYSVNRNLAEAFLSRAPAGFRDRFWNGYLADHMPIRAAPEMWEWLVQAEREINPAATVLPAGATNLGQTIEAELTQMRQWMAAPKGSADYQKYWGDEKMQARYRQLIDAQEGMAKKSKQAA